MSLPRLEVPMVWPTARMRKREEMIFRARRREALLVREEFETKMTNLVQAEESWEPKGPDPPPMLRLPPRNSWPH